MPTPKELEALLSQSEGELIERKQSLPNRGDLRKTLVAFANSVPDGGFAVLFIGVRDKGEICGVQGIDDAQKTIRSTAEQDCYPPIKFTISTIPKDGKEVLAVMIPHSPERPHFTGHSFVRRGSECVSASKEMLDEMIAMRNDKTRRIIAWKGKDISVEGKDPKAYPMHANVPWYMRRYRIEWCDGFSVMVHCIVPFDTKHTIPLDRVIVTHDGRQGNRLKLEVSGELPER
jgi:hypothetical protein